MIQPLADRILVRRIEPKGGIIITDKAKSQRGEIIAVGPGRWIPGEWYKLGGEWKRDANGLLYKDGGRWVWISGYRRPVEYSVGERVAFNSRWNDFRAGDYSQELPIGADETLHLVQEADIFGRINE